MIRIIILSSLMIFIFSCSSLLEYKKTNENFKNEEFEKQVKIIEVDESKTEIKPVLTSEPKTENKEELGKINTKSKTKTKNKNNKTKNIVHEKPLKRQPELEDSEGFENNRRPLLDPFRVGEKIVHEVSFIGASAGLISFVVKPYAFVNGKKNYNFYIDLRTNKFFSRVYAVEDQVQTYLDYETLTPGAFKLDIRDSGQVKEARAFFDFDKMNASYWEHRYTEKSGHEEKKLEWKIEPYSQNSFSGIFYMRVFKWVVGKEYQFRVADDEKNVIFKAKALEKVNLKTAVGEFKAIKLKAEVVTTGNLSKARDFYIWISDDVRKYILRIEVDLPIGSLISQIVELNEGQ